MPLTTPNATIMTTLCPMPHALLLLALSLLKSELMWLADPAFRTLVWTLVWVVRNPPFSKKPLLGQVLMPVYTDTLRRLSKTSCYPPSALQCRIKAIMSLLPHAYISYLLFDSILVIPNSTLSHSIHSEPTQLRVAHQSFPLIHFLSFPFLGTIA